MSSAKIVRFLLTVSLLLLTAFCESAPDVVIKTREMTFLTRTFWPLADSQLLIESGACTVTGHRGTGPK